MPATDAVRLLLDPDDAADDGGRRRPRPRAQRDLELAPELHFLLEDDADAAPAHVERPPLEGRPDSP